MSATGILLRRWTVACGLGELLGFGAAALWAVAAVGAFGVDPPSLGGRLGVLALMVLAGVCEGTVLAILQWSVLRMVFPSLGLTAWLTPTVAVAAAGWLFGMLPSTFIAPQTPSGGPSWEPPLAVVLSGAALFGAAAGALFGWAQWLTLRHHVSGASRWIKANALGWAIGLPWSYLAGTIGDVSQSVPRAIAVGALAGALMGISVALVTGFTLCELDHARTTLRRSP